MSNAAPNAPTAAPETFSLNDAADQMSDATPETPVAHVGTDENGFPTSYEDPMPVTADAPAATPTANGTPPKPAKVKVTNKAKKKAAKAAASANGAAPAAADAPAAAKEPKAKKEKAAKARAYGGLKRPEGKIVTLPTKELTLDRRLQSRATMYDEETVEKYKDVHLEDPNAMPPVEVVDVGEEEAEALKLPSRYVVWDGFQRTESRRRAKLADIRARVTVGTFDQARFWSLSANATHGLPRTSADIRKAFQRFLEDDELKDAVLKAGAGKGGANRAISLALNVSKGMVSKVLNALGLTTKGDKIVKKTTKADDAPAGPRTTAADVSPGLRVESKEAIKSRLTAAIVKEMMFAAAQLQRRYESLLERDDIKGLFRQVCQKNGVPVTSDENTSADGRKVVTTEYWPAADTILKALEELDDQYTKMNTQSSR